MSPASTTTTTGRLAGRLDPGRHRHDLGFLVGLHRHGRGRPRSGSGSASGSSCWACIVGKVMQMMASFARRRARAARGRRRPTAAPTPAGLGRRRGVLTFLEHAADRLAPPRVPQ